MHGDRQAVGRRRYRKLPARGPEVALWETTHRAPGKRIRFVPTVPSGAASRWIPHAKLAATRAAGEMAPSCQVAEPSRRWAPCALLLRTVLKVTLMADCDSLALAEPIDQGTQKH